VAHPIADKWLDHKNVANFTADRTECLNAIVFKMCKPITKTVDE